MSERVEIRLRVCARCGHEECPCQGRVKLARRLPARREPWDPALNEEQRAQTQQFWSKHALSLA